MASSVRFDDHSAGAETRALAAFSRAGDDATELLLEEANRTAPIEEGVLIGTGLAEFDGDQGTISYDGPYAAAQHEHTEFRHDPGRRAKWLELTLIEQADAVRDHLADEVRKALG